MQQAETGALWRAAAVLALVSALRWGWASWVPASEPSDESVLPELTASTSASAAEAARRSLPLSEGERIDPNRASEIDLDRLPGLGPSAARAIVEARESGRVFRRPEDLLEVRGIGEVTLERMRPGLDLSSPPPGRVSAERRGPTSAPEARPASGPSERVDVNGASVEELQALPGVGPALAERIVVARREQMFTSLDDLERVRGIGPATVERLRPFAVAGRGR